MYAVSLYYCLILFTIFNTASAYKSGPYFSDPPNANKGVPYKYKGTYKDLINVFEAKNIEFGFPTEEDREFALQQGLYNPDSAIPIDVDVYYPPRSWKPKIFMTVPRFGTGVPYSLAYVTDVQKPNGTEIQPYPNYDWHRTHGGDCDGLTSVYRIQIDSCGQMWILDSGEIEFIQYCPPQIVAIDLASDTITHRYRLPETMFKHNISRFVTPLVDIIDNAPLGECREAFIYMADPTGVGLVVYDVANSHSWRIENKYTYPDPEFGTHTIAGESFELLDGVFGLTMTPRGLGLQRFLFAHSLSNDMQVAIPLDVLNNATHWGHGIASSLDKIIPLGKRGVQCAASAMTAHGFLLCGYLNPIGLVGWNIRTSYTKQNRVVLAENAITLQFISGLKVIRHPNGKDEVWMLSNRLQKAFTGNANYNEINYRIQRCGVDELLLKKRCKS